MQWCHHYTHQSTKRAVCGLVRAARALTTSPMHLVTGKGAAGLSRRLPQQHQGAAGELRFWQIEA